VAQQVRVLRGPRRHNGVPDEEVAPGAGVPLDQGNVDIRRRSHRVRFAHEWHDDEGSWLRSYGNENWLFAGNGLMSRRYANINDVAIDEAARTFRWPLNGPRPTEHPGLGNLDP